MVVAVGHAIVAGIFEVVVPIGPAVCLKWRATRHVAHAAPARLVYILVGPCIPVLPVGVVGVNPSAVQIVQFVCFKVVWRFYSTISLSSVFMSFASRTMRASPGM